MRKSSINTSDSNQNFQGPDAYKALAPFYDILELDETGSTKSLNAFLKSQLMNAKVSKVADVCCGTGAQSLELAKFFQVQATDLSESMIEQAQIKLSKIEKLPVEFSVANMVDVNLEQAEAIIAMYNGIGHLSLEDFVQALKNWHSQLQEPGLIIFDCFSREYYEEWSEPVRLDFDQETPKGHIRRWVKSHVNTTSNGAYLDSLWTTSIDGQVSYDVSSVRLYSRAEIQESLLSVGFQLVSTKALSEGDMVIYVAQRQGM